MDSMGEDVNSREKIDRKPSSAIARQTQHALRVCSKKINNGIMAIFTRLNFGRGWG